MVCLDFRLGAFERGFAFVVSRQNVLMLVRYLAANRFRKGVPTPVRRKPTESDERYAAQPERHGVEMKSVGPEKVLVIKFVVPIAVNVQYRALERS